MSDTQTRHLEGNYAPVSDEVTAFDLPVTGTIPPALNGRLLRIGPNPYDGASGHWFSGTGMAHGVRLEEGRAAWYRNRYVRGDRVAEAKGWPEVEGPRHGMGDGNANTNIIHQGGTTFAIVEAGSYPVALDDELDTIARDNFGGTLEGSFTAHPKLDAESGELHAITYYWEWDHVRYVVVDPTGAVRREVQVPVPGRPMIHDCSITESAVLIYDLPVHFDLEAAMGGMSMPYQWNLEHGARVGVLPREGDASEVVWCEVEPCYVFHPLNAYDTGDGKIVADVIRHPHMFASRSSMPGGGPPILARWTIDPSTSKVLEEVVSDRNQEFPRVDERLVGRRHRWGYGVYSGDGSLYRGAVKNDVETGESEFRDHGDGRFCQEPVFVPRTADADEDDGWLLAYVHDENTQTCDVEIWESQDFTGDPVALIHLPQRVPYGFHGNWVPDVEESSAAV